MQIDELFEIMIERVNKGVFMKALVLRLSVEKSPILQLLIRLASHIIKYSKEQDIFGSLESLIEVFKKVSFFTCMGDCTVFYN